MSSQEAAKKRGFTAAEKWIIWGVFCLLVGLSSHMSAFLGLLGVSAGAAVIRRGWRGRRLPWLGLGLLLAVGALVLLAFGHRLW